MPTHNDEEQIALRLAHRFDKPRCIVIFQDRDGQITSSVHGCHLGEIVEVTSAVLHSAAQQAAKAMPRWPKVDQARDAGSPDQVRGAAPTLPHRAEEDGQVLQ